MQYIMNKKYFYDSNFHQSKISTRVLFYQCTFTTVFEIFIDLFIIPRLLPTLPDVTTEAQRNWSSV